MFPTFVFNPACLSRTCSLVRASENTKVFQQREAAEYNTAVAPDPRGQAVVRRGQGGRHPRLGGRGERYHYIRPVRSARLPFRLVSFGFERKSEN